MADSEASLQPGLRCWNCGERFTLANLLKHGIIRSRTVREGGPFRMHTCTACERLNMCEKTRGGRWFSSPTFQPRLLDFLLGKLFLTQAEDFLTAASWYEANEERRRYFFERDGDSRYSASFIARLNPLRRTKPPADRDSASRAKSKPDRDANRETPRNEGARSHSRPRPVRPRVLSPWEILGVEKGADESQIRRAFHRLAIQYHPDKVHHLGEAFQRMATIKFKELQRAYDSLLRPPSF